jgi:hypothetical protein
MRSGAISRGLLEIELLSRSFGAMKMIRKVRMGLPQRCYDIKGMR